MSEAEKPGEKKPYDPPELRIYGNVRDLTKTVNAAGGVDGGSFPGNRTGVVT